MRKILDRIQCFLYEEDAPTAVEYGVMVALIAAVVITGAALMGTNTQAAFNFVGTEIGTVTPAP